MSQIESAIAADGTKHLWQANPYWVRVTLHETGGRVPQYLTLSGNDREVEIGAFLSPEARLVLAAELRAAFAAVQ